MSLQKIISEDYGYSYSSGCDYEYAYNCVSPEDTGELDYIIENMEEVGWNEFIENVGEEQIERLGLNTEGVSLEDDYAVRFEYIDGCYEGYRLEAYIMVHSSIEYIFKNVDVEDEHCNSVEIESTSISGNDFYHGSVINESFDYKLIEYLDPQYSDFEASWITDDEYIAQQFSLEWYGEQELPVVYKLDVSLNNVAKINMDKYDELVDYYYRGDDLREYIPLLKDMGFDGWETKGSIGMDQYTDIAVFYSEDVEIYECSLYLNNRWTDYYNIDKVQQEINKRL